MSIRKKNDFLLFYKTLTKCAEKDKIYRKDFFRRLCFLNNGFRTWAEIDIDALLYNTEKICSAIGKEAELIAVVKANAYGHGDIDICRYLSGYVKGFAVACYDEAAGLRRSGVTERVLILGAIDESNIEKAVCDNISITVFSVDTAKKINDAAKKYGKRAEIFLAVDTGMSRIGLSCDEAGLCEALKIYSMDSLSPYCIFSHPACADLPDSPVTARQKKLFETFIRVLEQHGAYFSHKCFHNSAALLGYGRWGDLYKIGIIMYGLSPAKEMHAELRPVLSLKTKVAQVKTVEAGEGISYGHTFIAQKKMKTATLCIGYADGLPTALSGRGGVLIKGQYAPILGRICMDQMMVDISDIDGVNAGDVATVIGRDGSLCISADDVAHIADTINYDVVCGIGMRVPRVYMKNGKAESVRSYINPDMNTK